MCGIFGLYARDSADPIAADTLARMGASLAHRGPDGGGVRVDGAVGIGMRRLSIIDLPGGDQPLANEDGSIWVVFNGEIYNYRQLTADLAARGHVFRTRSDTEVLVHLYEEDGDRCVERLRGMFAFAIWDAPRRRLFLARDRLGIKPLYWGSTPRGFVFGSELKAVLATPWLERRFAPEATTAYLRFGYVPDPMSLLCDVAKLAPGHTLSVHEGRAGEPRRYWDVLRFLEEESPSLDEEAHAERLWEQLRDAVTSHLVSDVPLGAFLSGGIDSSAVVAAMALVNGQPVKTFSVGFEGGFDELPYARRVAEYFGTEHHELRMQAADVATLDEILVGFDEPFADASAIPTHLVSRLARQHVKVVLSGDGGDELFAGYDRYVIDERRRRLGVLGDLGLGGGLRALSAILPETTPGKRYLYSLSLPRMQRYLNEISLFPPAELKQLLGVDGARLAAAGAPFEESFRKSRGLDPLSRLQYLDLTTYLPGDILTKVDRMSMLASLEARVPLLDAPFVEFACRVPPERRMRSGETKILLKRAIASRVPAEVLRRPKQGFAVPLEKWFSDDVPGFFQERLSNTHRLESLGIAGSFVGATLEQFIRTRREEHCRRLWALLVLDRCLARLSDAIPHD
jgi:asparagine synthase (glutamine-hydrolysing)